MQKSLFIVNGTVRSGSTWSFNVVRKLAAELAQQRGEPSGSTFLDHHQLDTFLTAQADRIPGPTVIKTHGTGPLTLQWLKAGKACAVCTYRDPRDCVASDMTFLGWDMDSVVRRVYANFEFLKSLRGISSVLMIRYEDMMRNTAAHIRKIANHLNIDIADDKIIRIDGETNIQGSLKIVQQIKHKPDSQVLHIANHKVDPTTHLHHNHIHNSKVGRWRDELSYDQGERLTQLFRPWLVELGYEPSATGSTTIAS